MTDDLSAALATPALQAELMATAHALADAARVATLRHFRTAGLAADTKRDDHFDPVTAADREAETAMREILARRRPEDGILGEEHGTQAGTSGLTWVLDPIDGTRAYISGCPSWGVLIGLDAGAGPVMGIVDQPWTGERFIGGFGAARLERGGAATPLAVRPCANLGSATLFTTFPEVGTPAERAGFEAVRDRVRLTRYGLDCYAYALVALGQVDLVIEAGLQAYDVQGPIAVIEAAGGIVTNWQGGPAHMGGRVLAAGDARVHAAALERLSRA
ncbi:histidinol-phosphatase [Paroceanicella profunda]|uniref:Histidinol-phosphatase n=1 Tax=Paroceanicella profunda TaxID=2579971 RepID=A0A5B8FG31_9RHOB|nr:histidinol-phosphatase [Paroceanicella profunda]QDL90721.1 histidinol-phosphatase [Paroceanicella profunda]